MSALSRIAVLAACALTFADGMYFKLEEGKRRCFLEEVPMDTLVVAMYENPDASNASPDSKVTVLVTVSDPTGVEVLSREADSKGKVAFTSQKQGEHTICISTRSSRWMSSPRTFRFDLTINIGEMAIDYSEVAKTEHLSSLEVEMRKLNDKAVDIQREQQYQRSREIEFRDETEKTNDRVKWWSIAQIVVLVLCAVWQVLHMWRYMGTRKSA